MNGGFVNSDIVFGCDNPTNNPISVWILILLMQFLGLTTPAVLSFTRGIAREFGQTWSCLWGVTIADVTPIFCCCCCRVFFAFFFFFFFFFFERLTLQDGFVNLHIVFGCDKPTYNPSSVWKLILLTQFSGLTILLSLVTRGGLQGG